MVTRGLWNLHVDGTKLPFLTKYLLTSSQGSGTVGSTLLAEFLHRQIHEQL